jgi:hypothetical protein
MQLSSKEEAQILDYLGYEFKFGVALDEIEIALGKAQEASQLLATLAKEARAKGFLAIASRA